MNWPAQAQALIERGEPVALITLIDVKGSAPREAGACMIVWADGQCDTIGGGNLEYMIAHEARAMLAAGDDGFQRDYPLGPILGQCCGGVVRVRCERLSRADSFRLLATARAEEASKAAALIFGAGHVGAALARALAPLPFVLRSYDPRPEYADVATAYDHPEHVVAAAEPGAFYVALTHNHDLDYEIVRAVLARRDAAYCGLIGSKSKRARFERSLRADGLASELRRLTCPIGGSIALKGKAPAVIAAATAAEMMLVLESQQADTAAEAARAE
jgi:xanthine dehydrogenase accessory factor